ncbi:MATE family efflux transporter [bacterium]|nr:MATE family efflux transporter [bacterium]
MSKNTVNGCGNGNGQNNPLVNDRLERQVFILAWPTMLAMVLQTLFSLIDAFWVGKLGAEALAAVSGASFILWAIYSVCHISATGITALVARYCGADRMDLARLSGSLGLLVSALIGIAVGLVGIGSMTPLFRIMDLPIEVAVLARQYLGYYLAGIPLAFIYMGLESIFRASGDTKTPMGILAMTLIANAVLDPLLIFGYLGFPILGVRGAAIATIMSYGLGLVISHPILKRRALLPRLFSREWLVVDFSLVWSIIRIGSPVAISGVSFSLIYILLTRVISHFGTASLAALGMGHRLEGIAYLASVGFAIAASTLVGQNLGAGKPDRAERAAWLATLYGSIAMGVFALIAVFFAPQIIALFINDQEVIILGSQYLYIIACCEVFLAFEIILEGAFSGAGDTLPPMLISIPLTALRFPVAYLCAITWGMGLLSVWWAISLSTLLKGIISAYWFYRGKWKTRKISRDKPELPLVEMPVVTVGLSAANEH